MESMIPSGHLLRKIDAMISFDFIYETLTPYYPMIGRLSIDPISMFKMLLVGYLYGINSERRFVEDIQLNIVYRWFCGFELGDTIPDHSTFSKTRVRNAYLVPDVPPVLIKPASGEGFLPASVTLRFFRGLSRVRTAEYTHMMRLRKIWAEGSFFAMKRAYCLSKI